MNNPSQASGGQYFSHDPQVRSDPTRIELVLPDLVLNLTTDTGVFARKAVDPGTKLLLLDGPSPTPGDRDLLDLGCGYGPIALTLARRNPQATVWAVDINSRARDLCRSNAADNSLDNVKVAAPDELPDGVGFDRIWSNPPIRIGKNQLHQLLVRWLIRLTDEGSAHLVVQKHLGADSLQKWLTGQGWPTTRRGSKAAYRLLDVAAPVTDSNLNESSDRP